MPISLDPKPIVSFEELLMFQVIPTRNPQKVACGVGNIHQGGVFGDGEGGGSGDEEEEGGIKRRMK